MTLVILAAGIGSRYGGLKQMDPIGPSGEFIIDYSVYDAVCAGFDKVVFIIKKEIEDDFRNTIGKRIEKKIKVDYVFQCIEDLPEGYTVPEGRTKPWGTSQALLAAKKAVKEDFIVINSDDFYGRDAFFSIADYLKNRTKSEDREYAMVGYVLKNTLSENGSVARGVCRTSDGFLVEINERTKIQRNDGNVQFYEEETGWTDVDEDSIVSMNFWAFDSSIFDELEKREPEFLDNLKNPQKDEYLLPISVRDIMNDNLCKVKVLTSNAKWYGVTYREDKKPVSDYIRGLIESGVYPKNLWN